MKTNKSILIRNLMVPVAATVIGALAINGSSTNVLPDSYGKGQSINVKVATSCLPEIPAASLTPVTPETPELFLATLDLADALACPQEQNTKGGASE